MKLRSKHNRLKAKKVTLMVTVRPNKKIIKKQNSSTTYWIMTVDQLTAAIMALMTSQN